MSFFPKNVEFDIIYSGRYRFEDHFENSLNKKNQRSRHQIVCVPKVLKYESEPFTCVKSLSLILIQICFISFDRKG